MKSVPQAKEYLKDLTKPNKMATNHASKKFKKTTTLFKEQAKQVIQTTRDANPRTRPTTSRKTDDEATEMDHEILDTQAEKNATQTNATQYRSFDSDLPPEQNPRTSSTPKNDALKKKEIYRINDSGPYIVLLDRIKIEPDMKPFYALNAGKILRKINVTEATVTHVGRHRNKLVFENRRDANKVLESNILEQYNAKAYIPNQVLFSTGVIRNVPEDMTTEELKIEIARQHPTIERVERITRYNRETKTEEMTTSVKITLKQNWLPEHIYGFYMRQPLQPFVYRPRMCTNCQRYGHSRTKCKSKARCARCGKDEHEESACTAKPFCVFCQKEGHRTSDKKCLQFQQEMKVNELMAVEKLSYIEAKRKVGQNRPKPTQKDFRETLKEAEIESFIRKPGKRSRKPSSHQTQLGNYAHIVGEPIQCEPTQPITENPHRTNTLDRILNELRSNCDKLADGKDSIDKDITKINTSMIIDQLENMTQTTINTTTNTTNITQQ
jgi:hypothetical protein